MSKSNGVHSAPTAATLWSKVPQAPPDSILGITEAFKADTHPDKMNLGVGAYRTEEGKPLVLNCVKKAELQLVNDATRDKEYIPMGGFPQFCKLAATLAFGADSPVLREGRVATVQALSGTGSLRVAGEFLRKHYSVDVVYLPSPTWGNHHNIFKNAGLEVCTYRYYQPQTRGVDYEALVEDLRAAPVGAIVVLHACAHNPTGADPTYQQWQGILQLVQEKQLLPFFDSAYQGFASGDLDEDAASIRMFASAGVEFLLAQSFAKNMGLYGERVGALSVVCRDPAVVKKVESQLKLVIRAMYSSPPRHGASIVIAVLGNPQLAEEWKVELKEMADRIKAMRECLYSALIDCGAPGDWSHVLKQIGMFSYTGLTKAQCERMASKWHIYMTLDGRISMAGLSAKRAPYLAEAMKECVLSA